MLLSLFWLARICQFYCLQPPISNLLDSPLLAKLPLKTTIKPLMLRCAIWHAHGISELLYQQIKQVLKIPSSGYIFIHLTHLNSFKYVQTCLDMLRHAQTCLNMLKCFEISWNLVKHVYMYVFKHVQMGPTMFRHNLVC